MTEQGEAPELRVFKIKLPMRIRTSSKKKQPLNLNVYRNLHFRSLSSQKNKFEKIAKKLLAGIPPLGVITLHYEVCPQTKRRLDIMNVGSIVDKYFSDSLTECGVIEDDDYVHIPQVTFVFGSLVKKEYILVTITEIEPRKEATPMRVLLDRNDIETALTTFVGTLNIPNANGVTLKVVDNEIQAEVFFGPIDEGTPEETAPKPKRGRGGRPKGSKNLPKVQEPEETADVDAPVQDSADLSGTGVAPATEDEGQADDTPSTTEEPVVEAKPRKNLFGDKEIPSSEDDGAAKVALDTAPEPVTKPKGSIFDS